MNPGRARLVNDPKDYKWSSYRFKIGQKEGSNLLDLDTLYMDMGKDDEERQRNYQKWFKESIPPEECDLIRRAVNKGSVFGNEQFKKKLENLLGREFEARGRGRPRKR